MATKKAKRARPAGHRASAAPKPITALVNGQVVGQILPEGSIQAAVERLARDHGLKAFNVRVNGEGIKTPDAVKPLAGCKTLEIYAKDTRG